MANNSIFDVVQIQGYFENLDSLRNQLINDENSINGQLAKKTDLKIFTQKFPLNDRNWTASNPHGYPILSRRITFPKHFILVPHVSVGIDGSNPGLKGYVENLTNVGCTVTIAYAVKATSFDATRRNHKISVASIGI
jgi:hypothetical protein